MGRHEDLNRWLDEATIVLAQYQASKVLTSNIDARYELPAVSLVCQDFNHDLCHPAAWGCHCGCHLSIRPEIAPPI